MAVACGSGSSGSSLSAGRAARLRFFGGQRLRFRGLRLGLGLGGFGIRLEHRHPWQRVVDDELVARRGQRLARRAGHPDAHHVPAQPLAALRQRDVVGITRDDHHVGEVGQPEHVLDGVDRQPDVGAVLAVRRGREELHQVDGAANQLPAVGGVQIGRPVRVRAGQHERAERRGEVDDRADVDRGPVQPIRVLVEPLGLVALKRVAPVHLVVPRNHDVVEVEVDRDAGGTGVRHGLSVRRAGCGRAGRPPRPAAPRPR